MFDMLINLTKAAISIAATPIAAVVDVVSLPSTAYNGEDAFKNTEDCLDSAGKAFKAATKVENE